MNTSPAAVCSLPRQTTTFIGRQHEIAEIIALLDNPECRLLTLLGPGGIGKTRLAIEAARLMMDRGGASVHGFKHLPTSSFFDGACFVPLQPLTSPDFIVRAIADALHFTFHGDQDPKQQLLGYLQGKRLLLVLDNFEHLTEGAALLPETLERAPDLKILATSRERLRLREEWLFVVEGMSFPEDAQITGWEDFAAVQLFLQSARRAGYTPTDADTASVVRICQLVEGLPLAVELAAAWVTVMPCGDIARAIEQNLDVLTTTIRNVPERHQSMRAAFEHSWKFLTDEERAAFRKLSVFRGGATREAAEQIAGATLVILASLVDKSMVRVDATGRYDLHELLRQYAADKLFEAGEVDATAELHGDYFLRLAEGAEAHVFGHEQIAWFDRLEADFDNLRIALIWSLESGNTEMGLRLVAALGWFFSERAYWSEGLDWLERMLAANPNAPAALRAKALHSAGALAGRLEDDRRLRELCGQALALARVANDGWNIAWSLSHFGNYLIGDPDQSAALLEESVALFRELGDAMGIAHTLVRRAWKAIQVQQDYVYGRVLLEEGALLAREAGDKVLTAWVQYMLGLIAWLQDSDLREAKFHFENCLVLFREARSPFYNVLILLADAEQALGNAERAERLYAESLLLLRESMPDHTYLSWILAGLVRTARSLGQFERAALMLGAANGLALDAKRNSHDIAHFDLGADAVTAVHSHLSETAFVEAWAAGRAMTPAQIIAYALESQTTPSKMSGTEHPLTLVKQPFVETLTDRELEVLRLIAEGLTNRDIADRLVIVHSTVRSHVYNLCQKLGARNRTQAVARARALHIL